MAPETHFKDNFSIKEICLIYQKNPKLSLGFFRNLNYVKFINCLKHFFVHHLRYGYINP